MSDSLVTLARDFFAAQDRLRGGPDPALCTADYQAWLGGSPPVPREFHEGFARAFYAAFPDLAHAVDDVFAASDRAAVRFTLRGTHQGAFFGIPATGRAVGGGRQRPPDGAGRPGLGAARHLRRSRAAATTRRAGLKLSHHPSRRLLPTA